MTLIPEKTAEPLVRLAAVTAPPRVSVVDLLVVVGTDFHPFDRLVEWVDEWVSLQPQGYRAVVQYGSGAAPQVADGSSLFAHDELQELMVKAEVIVMHGGPASIIEARRLGKLPVVVPRAPAHGEHVDEHQQRFTRRLSGLGLVALCETREAFFTTLTESKLDPSILAVSGDGAALGGATGNREGVEAVRRIVDDLIAASTGVSWLRRCFPPRSRGN